jgi:hypothetical protein
MAHHPPQHATNKTKLMHIVQNMWVEQWSTAQRAPQGPSRTQKEQGTALLRQKLRERRQKTSHNNLALAHAHTLVQAARALHPTQMWTHNMHTRATLILRDTGPRGHPCTTRIPRCTLGMFSHTPTIFFSRKVANRNPLQNRAGMEMVGCLFFVTHLVPPTSLLFTRHHLRQIADERWEDH